MEPNNPVGTQPIQPIPTKKTPWFLIILIILLASTTGIFAYKYYQVTKQLDQLTLDSQSRHSELDSESTPTPTTDPTANWQAYTDPNNRFSFKYPQYLENKGSVAGPYTGISIPIQTFADPKTQIEGTGAPFDGFSLYYVSDIKTTNFEAYLQNEKQAMDNTEYAAMTGAKKISLQNKGIAFTTNTRGYYYFPTENESQVVVFGYIQLNQSFKSTFDLILSTFQFTSQETN